MTTPFHYSKHFILDKAYYGECFDASVTQAPKLADYYKAIGFLLMGLALLMTGVNAYASWFIVGLGVLEALSVKYKRPWYLWRQMMSKAAGNEACLTLDEEGITTESLYVNQQLLWDSIDELKETDSGYLLRSGNRQHYLSKRHLNNESQDFLRKKCTKDD